MGDSKPIFSALLLLLRLCLVRRYVKATEIQGSTNLAAESDLLVTGFPVTRLYVVIPEELSLGTAIIDLSDQLAVKNLLSEPIGIRANTYSHQYRLLNTFDSHLFRITPQTGHITVATRLDRESLCANQKAQYCCNARAQLPTALMSDSNWRPVEQDGKAQLCHLVAHVSLQPNEEFIHSKDPIDTETSVQSNRLAMIYVYIRLDDINDHTPQFTSPTPSLNVPEDTSVNTVLHYFRIIDPDAGTNGLNEVKLTVLPLPPNSLQQNSQTTEDIAHELTSFVANPFMIQMTRDGANLVLQYGLDHEIIPAYDITLLAVDGAKNKPRSSQMSMRVFVTDVNDNPPVWIGGKSDEEFDSSPHRVGFGLVDQPFVPQYNVSIPEDTQVGALVYWLQARDADLGDNARLHYAIDASAPGGLLALDYFSIQSTTGELRLRTQLDYDTASTMATGPLLEVPVIVRDSPRSGRQLSARAMLHVRILDVNDNHPIIVASPLSAVSSRRPYPFSPVSNQLVAFTIWENQPAGRPVASILVSDPDTGDGGKVTCKVQNAFFGLAGESAKMDYFSTFGNTAFHESPRNDGISGPVTYQLISTQKLDREQIARHHVLLSCRDMDPSRPLVSNRRIDIEVLDENDNAPQFTESPIGLRCMENAPPGQIIGRLNATDSDVGENAQLRYWVDESSLSWVNVHAQTGEVRVNTIFDREAESERQFVAFVSDGHATIAHTASVTVRVEITDENDHSPHFTDLYFFSLLENSPAGTEIGQIKAEDEDSGDNGRVHYLLRHPSREFELDKTTGRLTVRAARNDQLISGKQELAHKAPTFLDREQQDNYELTVIAEDSGSPPRRSTTIVHISLSDVNDHAPVFRYPIPHGPGSVLNVSCAQLSSQVIARVYANDSDSGPNGEIEYSIIRTHRRIKRQPKINVTDPAKPLTLSKQNNPDTVHNLTSAKVHDNNVTTAERLTSTRTSSLRHTKSTPDTDLLLGGPTENHFEVNSYNGQLFLIHPILDCSQSADIRLLIKAQDAGTPPRSSTAMLTVHVQPTEQTVVFVPIRDDTLGAANDRGDQVGHDATSRAMWMGRLGGVDRRKPQHKSWIAASADTSGAPVFGSSHWSAIIGLVVAMVILVLLLCLMLVVLRRRFLLDDQKVSGKKSQLHRPSDGTHTVHTSLRPMDGVHSSLLFKDSQTARSLHELATGSPQQRSISPTTMAPTDDLNCSSVTLELNQPTMNTHYFCTLPPPSTTMTLNSGELAVIHRDGRAGFATGTMHTMDSPRRFDPRGHILYKATNGNSYGYVDPQTRNMSRGHVHQLQQAGCRVQHLDAFTTEAKNSFNKNTNSFRRNIWTDTPYACCNKNNQYTPLLEATIEGKLLHQASQPDLSKEKNRLKHEDAVMKNKNADKVVLYACERAFSLTDLTPDKMELLPENKTTMETVKLANKPTATGQRDTVPVSDQPNVCCLQVMSKPTLIEMESRLSGEIGNSYNTASFV